VESLTRLKETHPDVAWDPAMDSVLANLKEGIPADSGGHEHHGS